MLELIIIFNFYLYADAKIGGEISPIFIPALGNFLQRFIRIGEKPGILFSHV
jgi:hypothetical protein